MHHSERAYQYADLILRHLKGELNDQEVEILNDWLESDSKNMQFMKDLQNESSVAEEMDFFSSLNTENAWTNVVEGRKSKGTNKPFQFIKYAAAILLLLFSASVAYYIVNQKQPNLTVRKNSKVKHDISPGGDKAKLTLADGSVIVLEDIGNGTIKSIEGVKISKIDGQLVYEVTSKASDNRLSFNTISTPAGGQYQVILPDASKVWLNASSSLTYPTSFSGKSRSVKLNGEAYFEVAKNKAMPFKVITGDSEIQVLGTHFNVAAYADESNVNTTLLEGSVKVSKGNSSRLIVPGQKAITTRLSQSIDVSEADIEEAVAWKEGVFLFNNQELPLLMRQISRWYNVDIQYMGEIPSGHFTGKISRNNNISKILNLLELTGGVHFSIEDKKIKVYR